MVAPHVKGIGCASFIARAVATFTQNVSSVRKYYVAKIGAVMESEISEIPAVFAKLISDEAQFEALSKLLTENKIQSVLILARGTSDNAAHFLKYLIETKLGLPVGLTSPSSVTIYKAKLKFENTLIVAISQSGQSTDLVEYAKAAKASGGLLISMTNDALSPLAALADFHINLHAGKELAVAATKSYAAQLLASLLLVRSWIGDKSNLDELVTQASDLAQNSELVTNAIKSCSRDHEIVTLGRGFSYPNAREAALKIQETSKISIQGLSMADYMHGPISALTKSTQVIILAPNGLPASSIKDDVSRIRKDGPKIIWIGNSELAEADDIVIAGAKCSNEIYSSIVDSILLQRFALEFARKNGLDPDSPQGLSKVTLTI